jgi:hypothetical protein
VVLSKNISNKKHIFSVKILETSKDEEISDVFSIRQTDLNEYNESTKLIFENYLRKCMIGQKVWVKYECNSGKDSSESVSQEVFNDNLKSCDESIFEDVSNTIRNAILEVYQVHESPTSFTYKALELSLTKLNS